MQRILATLFALLLLIPLAMVSAVLFAIALVVGHAVLGWFWWHTRALRRELRARMEAQRQAQQAGAPSPDGGIIIEGEVVREGDVLPRIDRQP